MSAQARNGSGSCAPNRVDRSRQRRQLSVIRERDRTVVEIDDSLRWVFLRGKAKPGGTAERVRRLRPDVGDEGFLLSLNSETRADGQRHGVSADCTHRTDSADDGCRVEPSELALLSDVLPRELRDA